MHPGGVNLPETSTHRGGILPLHLCPEVTLPKLIHAPKRLLPRASSHCGDSSPALSRTAEEFSPAMSTLSQEHPSTAKESSSAHPRTAEGLHGTSTNLGEVSAVRPRAVEVIPPVGVVLLGRVLTYGTKPLYTCSHQKRNEHKR